MVVSPIGTYKIDFPFSYTFSLLLGRFFLVLSVVLDACCMNPFLNNNSNCVARFDVFLFIDSLAALSIGLYVFVSKCFHIG